ncbi:hypothetical protein ACJIZ3_004391 [Penstemon smallii]|uniref:Uncharacterized protein n=1 Tax=Penstemon smallii TaxID=265156 RepID=A0ABD3S257_9LAMI
MEGRKKFTTHPFLAAIIHTDVSDSVCFPLAIEGWSISLRDASHSCCSTPNFLSSINPRSTVTPEILSAIRVTNAKISSCETCIIKGDVQKKSEGHEPNADKNNIMPMFNHRLLVLKDQDIPSDRDTPPDGPSLCFLSLPSGSNNETLIA